MWKRIAGSTVGTRDWLIIAHKDNPAATIAQLKAILSDETRFIPDPAAMTVLDAYIETGAGDTVPDWD